MPKIVLIPTFLEDYSQAPGVRAIATRLVDDCSKSDQNVFLGGDRVRVVVESIDLDSAPNGPAARGYAWNINLKRDDKAPDEIGFVTFYCPLPPEDTSRVCLFSQFKYKLESSRRVYDQAYGMQEKDE